MAISAGTGFPAGHRWRIVVMKIVEIMLSSRFGGAERLFVDVCRTLADRGHSLLAVCHPDFEGGSLLNHPRIIKAGLLCHWDWSPLARFRLKIEIERFKGQVIHTHLARAAAVGGDVGKRLDLPTVANLHNYVNLKYYRNINWFCPGTEDQKLYLTREGIAPDRIQVVPHFSCIPIKEVDLRSSFPSPPVFLSYGRFVAKKGFHVLIQAVEILKRRNIKVNLLLGGDGPEREHLESMVKSLGLQQQVIFQGWVNDVQSFLDQGYLFVLPSLDEPFGIVMLEAMARGKVIISTRVQGPSEILDEETAYLCQPADPHALAEQMEKSLADHSQALAKAVKAQQYYVERYSAKCIVPVYEEMFSALVTSGGLLKPGSKRE